MKKLDSEVDFSLGVGGPLYRLYLFARLLKKPLLLPERRIIFIALIAWLPLLLLSVMSGLAFGGVKVPFMFDIDVHVRFLVALSLLIFAEVVAHNRMQVIVRQFLNCNIVALKDKPKFMHIISSSMRLTNLVLVEIALVVLVYTVGRWISVEFIPLGVPCWYGDKINDIAKLSPAGYWYIFVSLPLFQFILLRWYYRMVIWYRFLWQVSRLPLQLNSLHPDRAGGLGFLATSVYAFEPFLLAHTVLLSGMIFNRIWHAGAVLSDFQTVIFGVLIVMVLVPLFPLLFYLFLLIKEKRTGTMEYDVVANHYVNEFRQKWIKAKSKKAEVLLGTQDIQALADLSNSFEVSNQMRITPFSRKNVIALVVMISLPLVPLIFTILPLEKFISQALSLIF